MLKPNRKQQMDTLLSGLYTLHDRNGEFVIICKKKQQGHESLEKSEVTTGGVVSRSSTSIQVLKIYHHEIQIVHQKTQRGKNMDLLMKRESGTQWLRESFRIFQMPNVAHSFFDMTQGTPGRAEDEINILQFWAGSEPGHKVAGCFC